MTMVENPNVNTGGTLGRMNRVHRYILTLSSFIFTIVLVAGCGGKPLLPNTDLETQVLAVPNDSYRLGPHDVLALSVYGEEDFTKQIQVDGLGTIRVPLIGELDIGGKTIEEAESILTSRLKAGYLKDPKVSLSIVQYRNFYVHGEVRQPGAYPYQTGLTVLKAITYAGGFTDRAAKGRTKVIRIINGKEERLSGEMNALIFPDDLVMVPESFF